MPLDDAIARGGLAEWNVTSAGGVGGWPMAALACAAAVAVVWTWRSLDPALGLRARVGISALRTAALAAILCLLAQPTLSVRTLGAVSDAVAVLVDDSASMSSGEGAPRRREVSDILARARPDLERLAKRRRLSWYRFGAGLSPIPGPEEAFSDGPGDDRTDIRGALEEISRRSGRLPVAAAVVIGDGADTEMAAAGAGRDLSWADALPFPVNTVAITPPSRARDLAITEVRADPFAFSRSETPIEVLVDSVGLEDRDVEITLWRDGSVLQKRSVGLVGGTARTTFSLMPSRLGRHVVTATIPIPEGDEIPENNTAHATFEVARDKIRVLHLSGRPSWDQRFLRETLSAEPHVDLVSFYILRTPYQSSVLGSSGLALIPFPTEEIFEHHLDEFDLLVLQDFEPAEVGVDRYLEKISSFARRGGALVVVGGERAFGAGTVTGRLLADVLPVRLLSPGARRSSLAKEAPFLPVLTDAGRRHPLTRIAGDEKENADLWASLARLDGIASVAGMAPGGIALAAHPSEAADDGPAPVIAVREVGDGRTLAISTDSLWRWRFSGPMGGGPPDMYQDFWMRAIAWLGRDPELDRLRIRLSPSPVLEGSRVTIDVEMLDESYEPVPGAQLECAVSWIDEAGVERRDAFDIRLDDEGRYRREWLPEIPGPHRVEVSGADRPAIEDRFLVEPATRERGRLEPDELLLEELAAITGGRFQADRLGVDELELGPTSGREVLSREDVPLWNHPLAFVLILALLAGEWLLRRRAGLR